MSLFVAVSFAGCGKQYSDSKPNPTPSVVTTAPMISATTPANNDKNVFINRKISATFNNELRASSVTGATFTLKKGTTGVSGVVSAVGNVATFKPETPLATSTEYTATLTTGITDSAGQTLALEKSWSFTTGDSSDTTAPTIASLEPLDGATGIALNRNITATLSEALDATTVSGTTFTVMQGSTPVTGTVSFAGTVATFKPSSNLAINTLYTVKMTTGVKDLAGNSLAQEKTWSFTTGAVIAAGPAPVALGAAANFAILSKTGITNVATSVITGDIGTSPITGAAIVGLDCIQVVGKIIAVDPTGPACSETNSVYLTTAVSDMEIAYTDAAGRTSPTTTELNAGELGGLTVAPGLHKWGTNVLISTDVKLSGGANDVWIFQIAGDLTQSNGIHVNLEGGAQAKNIFWQVAGQVKIGTTAHFAGTVLSKTLIALKTSAQFTGRALAQTAVTLESNALSKP